MTDARIDELMAQAPVIVDGAWGTQLQRSGLPIGGCAEAWNLEYPERVEEVARAYVEAGSQIILTNSFCGNRVMLERHGLATRAAEINRKAAEISRRAAGERAQVFGSMGPTGKMPMLEEITLEQLSEIFTGQAMALQAGGADGIVIETMSALDEAECAVRAAKSTGLPVVACMVYDSGGAYDHTMMGVTPEQAAPALAAAGADVIGANCGVGIQEAIPVGARLVAATDLPVWMKPNAGMPEIVAGQAQYTMSPDEFGEAARKVVEIGARFVGGCCGTSPDFIRSVVAHLD